MSEIDEALEALEYLHDRALEGVSWAQNVHDASYTIRAALEQRKPDDGLDGPTIVVNGVRKLTGMEGEVSVPWAIEALERLEQWRVPRAKPIEWEHEFNKYDIQEWSDGRYGFVITFDPEEDPEFLYSAQWGELEAEHFNNLPDAQSWCQEQADALVREWADVDAAPKPEDDDGLS